MCTYSIDRDETVVAYLYDDIEPSARAAFEAHMASCEACRDEVQSLRGVRQQLAEWSAPQPEGVVDSRQFAVDRPRLVVENSRDPRAAALHHDRSSSSSWLPDIPAWAQAAAAVLIVGVAAGIANLDVRYDHNGLSIRTGWSKPSAPAAPATSTATAPARADLVSHDELVALEQRLRDEVRSVQSSHTVAAADTPSPRGGADADLMRRVRTLIDEGEKRQQRELALRVGEMMRDVNAQRQADLVRIDHSLGQMENNLGVEVLKQRERVNYLLRVNQRQ
jgi:hypothetical protein